MQNENKKGFTLIELLIVVVIIGILAAIAIPKFAATREKAYVSAMKSDLRNLATEQEVYYSDNFVYGALADLTFEPSQRVVVTAAPSDIGGTGQGFTAGATHVGTTDVCEYIYNPNTAGVVRCTGEAGFGS